MSKPTHAEMTAENDRMRGVIESLTYDNATLRLDRDALIAALRAEDDFDEHYCDCKLCDSRKRPCERGVILRDTSRRLRFAAYAKAEGRGE